MTEQKQATSSHDKKLLPIQTVVFLNLTHYSNDPSMVTKVNLVAAPREDFLETGHDKYQFQNQEVLILSIRRDSGFDESFFNSVRAFLCRQKRPVCLFSYGGNKFEFPVLKMKLEKVNVSGFDDLMCADSLFAFYDVLEHKPLEYGNAVRSEFCEGKSRPSASYKLWDIYERCFNRTSNIEKIKAEFDNVNKASLFISTFLGSKIIKWLDEKQRRFAEVKPTDLFT